MVFIFSIQTVNGTSQLFIFSMQYIWVKRYSVFKTVFSKVNYKVVSIQLSMQLYIPRSIQYSIRYSVNTLIIMQVVQQDALPPRFDDTN